MILSFQRKWKPSERRHFYIGGGAAQEIWLFLMKLLKVAGAAALMALLHRHFALFALDTQAVRARAFMRSGYQCWILNQRLLIAKLLHSF